MRTLALAAVVVMRASPALGQSGSARPPVIDMHVHSSTLTPKALPRLDSLNIRYVFLSGLPAELRARASVDSGRFLTALLFPCDHGRAPFSGIQCFDSSGLEFPDTVWLRQELQARRIRAFGELEPQFLGLSPADPRMEPYWRLAEEFDVPVGIHMGMAPPGLAYQASAIPFRSPLFRMTAGDPLLLEDALLRHQRLRVYVMHAGWPRLESMIALLYAHPHVYVDVAALHAVMPRAAYYAYLRSLVDAGFAKRIMFGSDSFAQVASGIDAILAAEFLSAEQKSDILCNNAARFLRLPASTCSQ